MSATALRLIWARRGVEQDMCERTLFASVADVAPVLEALCDVRFQGPGAEKVFNVAQGDSVRVEVVQLPEKSWITRDLDRLRSIHVSRHMRGTPHIVDSLCDVVAEAPVIGYETITLHRSPPTNAARGKDLVGVRAGLRPINLVLA